MNLIRDVLDNQLVDPSQRRMGKVDGIIVQLEKNRPPRVVYLEAGTATKLRRFHARLGKWAERRWPAYRIPWNKVRDVGVDIEVDVRAEDTPLLRFEKRARKFLLRIPGA